MIERADGDNNFEAYFLRGKALEALGKWPAALLDYEKAAEKGGNHSQKGELLGRGGKLAVRLNL